MEFCEGRPSSTYRHYPIHMLRFAYRHVVLPFYESVLHRRNNFRYWGELERSQWLPREALERIQFDNLRRMMAHTFEHCPYYREEWTRLGLSPADLKEPQDIWHWPLITRDTISNN